MSWTVIDLGTFGPAERPFPVKELMYKQIAEQMHKRYDFILEPNHRKSLLFYQKLSNSLVGTDDGTQYPGWPHPGFARNMIESLLDEFQVTVADMDDWAKWCNADGSKPYSGPKLTIQDESKFEKWDEILAALVNVLLHLRYKRKNVTVTLDSHSVQYFRRQEAKTNYFWIDPSCPSPPPWPTLSADSWGSWLQAGIDKSYVWYGNDFGHFTGGALGLHIKRGVNHVTRNSDEWHPENGYWYHYWTADFSTDKFLFSRTDLEECCPQIFPWPSDAPSGGPIRNHAGTMYQNSDAMLIAGQLLPVGSEVGVYTHFPVWDTDRPTFDPESYHATWGARAYISAMNGTQRTFFFLNHDRDGSHPLGVWPWYHVTTGYHGALCENHISGAQERMWTWTFHVTDPDPDQFLRFSVHLTTHGCVTGRLSIVGGVLDGDDVIVSLGNDFTLVLNEVLTTLGGQPPPYFQDGTVSGYIEPFNLTFW